MNQNYNLQSPKNIKTRSFGLPRTSVFLSNYENETVSGILIHSEYGENMRRYIRYMWSIYQLALLNQNREVFESIKRLTYAYTNSELMKYYPTGPDDDKKTGTDD